MEILAVTAAVALTMAHAAHLRRQQPLKLHLVGDYISVRTYVPDVAVVFRERDVLDGFTTVAPRDWKNEWLAKSAERGFTAEIAQRRLDFSPATPSRWSVDGLKLGGKCRNADHTRPLPAVPPEHEFIDSDRTFDTTCRCWSGETRAEHAVGPESPVVSVEGASLMLDGERLLDAQSTSDDVLARLGPPGQTGCWGNYSDLWTYFLGDLVLTVVLPPQNRTGTSYSLEYWALSESLSIKIARERQLRFTETLEALPYGE